MNPDTYFSLSVMASWLAYRVFDSIRHYNLATVYPFGSSNAHLVICNSQSELPYVPSPVCLSATCLGSPHADNFKALQLPKLYPIYPENGSKGDTTVEYMLCFELKTQTNSYLASSQFTALRPPLPKHGLHMSRTQNQRVVNSIGCRMQTCYRRSSRELGFGPLTITQTTRMMHRLWESMALPRLY